MADKKASSADAGPGPELRLLDRRAFVGFPELTLQPGVVLKDFALQIPDVSFPMNLTGGAARYQKKKLQFGTLELFLDAEVIQRAVRAAAPKLPQLHQVKLHFRPGHLEVEGRLEAPQPVPVTFKVAFDGDGDRLAVYLYDVRLYGFTTVPASRLAALLSEALPALQLLPEVERRGATGFSTRILPALVEQAAVGRGYKMPSLAQARLSEATVTPRGLSLRFSSGGLPPSGAGDDALLLALEGARAFSEAEELLAEGRLVEARAAYLKLGDVSEAHPFAAERLLTLLVADPQAHELALDVAAAVSRRRESSATALWAEAVVREHRGEFARAAERYLALATLARRQREDASAFLAAEAAARASRDHAPQLAVRALHELLGLQPDHLPSLQALARASDQAKDRAGAIRAYRRLTALSRNQAEAAEAHVQLARLCAETEDDLAGARLHCEAALRLAPDHPEALYQLGSLCYRAGEWLRAIKALDRLREVALGRHEVDRVGRASQLAGLVWETGLKQPENALLRFREAASLLPGQPEPLYLSARVAEGLGKLQEALAGYQQAVELAGPAPAEAAVRGAAHASHHALARLLKQKLGEPARAREHLEAALALEPQDALALDELLPYYRASGKAAELAAACEQAARGLDDPGRRAALWAEAGELYRGRLGQPERAERLLTQALEADPRSRMALEGLLALAEARRDGPLLCRCLLALADLAEGGAQRVRLLRRLAVAARDLTFDLEQAAHALREVLKVEPDDLPTLGELAALERRRAEMPGLAWALEQRARVAEAQGDKRLAAAALREQAQVLDARLGRAGEALVALEKAARLFPEAPTLMDLAALSLRVERPLNARRALEDVLALLPRHAPPETLAEVRARLGRACELLGDAEGARQHYAQAFPLRRLDDELAQRLEALYREAHLTTELTELWAARAQALLQAGRAQDAAPLFLQAAQAALQAGDTAAARVRLASALEAAPTGPRAGEVLELLAQVELERGAPEDAAALLARRAALVRGRDAARFLHRAATLCRDTPREVGFLTQALLADETFAPARLRRGELKEQDNPREALQDFEAVLAAEAHDEDAAALMADQAGLTRRAARAAQRSGQYEVARRWYARYTALQPTDTEALLELAGLHRRAGALEPLVDLLGDLWPRLTGSQRVALRREYAEGALSLGRPAAAVEALRAMVAEAPADDWAASRLLALLPADEAHAPERLAVLTRLVDAAAGEARAELLARRAELHRDLGDLSSARQDLTEAARLSARPLSHLRALAEYARQALDEPAEVVAWTLALERSGGVDGVLREDASRRLLALARSRLAAGDFALAAEACRALVKLPLGPQDAQEAWLALGQAARGRGDAPGAEAALKEAAALGSPAQRVEVLLECAGLQEGRGALAEAATTLNEALALVPGEPRAASALKRLLEALGDSPRLAQLLREEAPRLPPAEALAAWRELASLSAEDPAGAELALRHVVELDEADEASRHELARLLVARGATSDAVALLEAQAARSEVPAAARLLREAASLARKGGEGAAELDLLRRAHALVPATGAALAALAEALAATGASREALALQREVAAEAFFETDVARAEGAWLRLAELAEAAGDTALAEEALARVVEVQPGATGAAERLAALVGQRDPVAGLQLLARHLEALPPSATRSEALAALARQARVVAPADVALAARLYQAAVGEAAQPLAVHQALLELYRAQGLTVELVPELAAAAQLAVTSGEVALALALWDEEARLQEGLGRLDDALRTLTAMAELAEDEGLAPEAASALVRKALLWRDSKLDLGAAAEALEQAWALHPEAGTATLGEALARRRADREGELDWTERSLRHLSGPALVEGFVALARLHLGLPAEGPDDLAQAPLLAVDQAEAALRRALEVDFDAERPRALLAALLDRLDRPADLAAWYEEAAERAQGPGAKAALLLRAARLYRERAGKPEAAVAALLAARAAHPDDAALTAQVADLLVELGHPQDAADFDAQLVAADPFHPSYARHRAWLTAQDDSLALAALLSRRAEAAPPAEAAPDWLAAADAFARAGAQERAWTCEEQAFEADPASAEAFRRVMERAAAEPRRQAELLAARAERVPAEAAALLRQRARLLGSHAEALLAAAAWDDVLALAPLDGEALFARAELAAAGGGPRAAQAFDRRLVNLAEGEVPRAARLASWLRLGQAALESQAWHDAVDALQKVESLDGAGPLARRALGLLAEAHARLGDQAGQARTTLRAAALASGEEAEALYRRALALQPAAREPLEWLLQRHPGDAELYDRGLRTLAGDAPALVALHRRHAAAVGGSGAARALAAAAQLAQAPLGDAALALSLALEAVEAAPDEVATAELALGMARSAHDEARTLWLLERLADLVPGEARSAAWTLERSALLERQGRPAEAAAALEPLRRAGPAGAGYAQALEGLERLARGQGDTEALVELQLARSELEAAPERAESLLEVARTWRAAGHPDRARDAVKQSLSVHTSLAALELLVELARAAGQGDEAARGLTELADRRPAADRGATLLEAAEAWQAAAVPARAVQLLDRLLAEAPGALTPAEAAQRYLAAGAPRRAFEVGFEAALAGLDGRGALALADAAEDAPGVARALEGLALAEPGSLDAARFLELLRARGDEPALARFAHAAESSAPTVAAGVWTELARGHGRADAVEALARLGALAPLVGELAARATPAVVTALLARAGSLEPDTRRALYRGLLERGPGSRRQGFKALADLELAQGQPAEALAALTSLAQLEEAPAARAALHVQRGSLLQHQLGDPPGAIAAYERALLDDAGQVAAVRALVDLCRQGQPERFVALVERLRSLAGEEAVAPLQEALAEGYEALGRPRDAFLLLGQLPPEPARLQRRAQLAARLGLRGEALQLREQIASERAELETILSGYLTLDLTPFAVRLGERLRAEGPLSPPVLRLLAERLAPTDQGAELATRAWAELLAAAPADADGWTLYAEALRRLGREEDAALADGFGAALTSSQGAPAPVAPEPLPGVVPSALPPPPDCVEVAPDTMPRLHAALTAVLGAFGTPRPVLLDPQGGVEASLRGDTLVLGSGALAAFGQAELPFLVGLALRLGPAGAALAEAGEVPGFEDAARVAFQAYPCSLAALRVVAYLAPEARGRDPRSVDVGQVLRRSPVLPVLAQVALARLGR